MTCRHALAAKESGGIRQAGEKMGHRV
ncbi:hypothetical protein ACFSQD_10710 [Flavihumibacter stibioxidans]